MTHKYKYDNGRAMASPSRTQETCSAGSADVLDHAWRMAAIGIIGTVQSASVLEIWDLST